MGKGRDNGCLHLPSLGDMPALRRHAYVTGVGLGRHGVGLRWHTKNAMNSVSISKFSQTERKRLVNCLNKKTYRKRKRWVSKSQDCYEYIAGLI